MTDDNLIAFVQAEERDGKPFVTTRDVVEASDIKTTEGARRRLDRLAEDGVLKKKKIGARAVVYWRAGVRWPDCEVTEATPQENERI